MAIMEEFWGASNARVEWSRIYFDSYFEYFEDQCRLSLHNWDRHDISSLDFSQVILAAKLTQEGNSRAEVEESVESSVDAACRGLSSGIVDLAVRLLSMIQIGGFRNMLMPGQDSLAWMDGPFLDSLNSHFTRDNVLKESVDLVKAFTARNVERIAGIRIVWTSNLLDVRTYFTWLQSIESLWTFKC